MESHQRSKNVQHDAYSMCLWSKVSFWIRTWRLARGPTCSFFIVPVYKSELLNSSMEARQRSKMLIFHWTMLWDVFDSFGSVLGAPAHCRPSWRCFRSVFIFGEKLVLITPSSPSETCPLELVRAMISQCFASCFETGWYSQPPASPLKPAPMCPGSRRDLLDS